MYLCMMMVPKVTGRCIGKAMRRENCKYAYTHSMHILISVL